VYLTQFRSGEALFNGEQGPAGSFGGRTFDERYLPIGKKGGKVGNIRRGGKAGRDIQGLWGGSQETERHYLDLKKGMGERYRINCSPLLSGSSGPMRETSGFRKKRNQGGNLVPPAYGTKTSQTG